MIRTVTLGAGLALMTGCVLTGDRKVDSGELSDESGPTWASDSRGGHTGDMGDCGTYEGAVQIAVDSSLCEWPERDDPSSAITFDCDSANWWYDVYTVGWSGGADLWIYQTDSSTPRDEYHPMGSYDFDDQGWWDNLYLLLDTVAYSSDVVWGRSTLYFCDQARIDRLSWHLAVYDVSGADADCAVWGEDPSSLGTGCTEWF